MTPHPTPLQLLADIVELGVTDDVNNPYLQEILHRDIRGDLSIIELIEKLTAHAALKNIFENSIAQLLKIPVDRQSEQELLQLHEISIKGIKTAEDLSGHINVLMGKFTEIEKQALAGVYAIQKSINKYYGVETK